MPRQTRHPGNTILMTVMIISVSFAALLLIKQPFATGDEWESGREISSEMISFPVQIYPGSEAIALIDKRNQTICLYHYQIDKQPHERFVLLASRSYRFDSQLEDFNNAAPTPAQIKEMIERLNVSSEPSVEKKKPAPENVSIPLLEDIN